MGVAPDARELLGMKLPVHTLIEEVCHAAIIEMNAGCRDLLANRQEVLDIEEILFRRDAEAADFRVAGMAKNCSFSQASGAKVRTGGDLLRR